MGNKNWSFWVSVLFEWPQSLFAATKIYDMSIFNPIYPLINFWCQLLTVAFNKNYLNFYQVTNISLIKNESYQESTDKNGSGINKVLRKWKMTVNTKENINTLVFRVHVLMLHRLEINIFRAFWSNICGTGRIPTGINPFFPMKIVFPNSFINC